MNCETSENDERYLITGYSINIGIYFDLCSDYIMIKTDASEIINPFIHLHFFKETRRTVLGLIGTDSSVSEELRVQLLRYKATHTEANFAIVRLCNA